MAEVATAAATSEGVAAAPAESSDPARPYWRCGTTYCRMQRGSGKHPGNHEGSRH